MMGKSFVATGVPVAKTIMAREDDDVVVAVGVPVPKISRRFCCCDAIRWARLEMKRISIADMDKEEEKAFMPKQDSLSGVARDIPNVQGDENPKLCPTRPLITESQPPSPASATTLSDSPSESTPESLTDHQIDDDPATSSPPTKKRRLQQENESTKVDLLFVKERMTALLEQVDLYSIQDDYLARMQHQHQGEQSGINKCWREKTCEWAYAVIDHFLLDRQVVSITMSHLDRYLASYPTSIDKNAYRLLAMTCLYLSIKLNEHKHLLIPGAKSTMESILQLSWNHPFTAEEMEQMESDILEHLQWHVHPPTPQTVVKHFLFLLSIRDPEIQDLSQYMVELSVLDYFFVHYKASEVGMAAVLNAMEHVSPNLAAQVNISSLLPPTLFDCNSDNVRSCRDRLNRLNLIYDMQQEANDPAQTAASQNL